jgi:hypothetical protein
MAQGCAGGLGLLNELEANREPRDYFLLPASRAGVAAAANRLDGGFAGPLPAVAVGGVSRSAAGIFAAAAGDGEQT